MGETRNGMAAVYGQRLPLLACGVPYFNYVQIFQYYHATLLLFVKILVEIVPNWKK
jgi:hypothetical protein